MADYDPIDVAHVWSKVRIPVAPRHEDMCWEWTGSLISGYGQIKLKGAVLRAHCVTYEIVKGDIPDGMHILHSCDNRKCVNPAHLRAGTHQENMADLKERGPNPPRKRSPRMKVCPSCHATYVAQHDRTEAPSFLDVKMGRV